MRTLRGLAAMLFVVALFLPVGGGAGAIEADATLRLEKQGWYWRHAQRVEAEPPACPDPTSGVPCPNVTQQPNPIEADHLAVGYSARAPEAEREQAIAVLQFDLSWMDVDTEVTRARLRLEESNDDGTHRGRQPSGVVNADAPGTKLRACLVTNFWGPSQPALWEELPPIDRNVCGTGKREQIQLDGRAAPVWTFDIGAIAARWGQDPLQNHGLAILPAADASGDFQVTFHGDTRVVTMDAVTRREQVEPLVRVFATLRFDAPASALPGGGRTPAGPGSLSAGRASALGAAPVFAGPGGSAVDIGTPGPGLLAVPDVNRDVTLERTTATGGTAPPSMPAYMWLGVPAGLLVGRLFALLFSGGGPRVRVNRVAAARRRMPI